MSRRSRLTVEILIRMPLPSGKKADAALKFLRDAMVQWPLANQCVVKLAKRETVYL